MLDFNSSLAIIMIQNAVKSLSIKTLILGSFILYAFTAEVVLAGFGVTPPHVRNTSMTRGTVYDQQILLVRGNPTKSLKASFSISAPDFDGWVEILEGDEIILPRGENKVPINVRVRVPSDAEFKDYRGNIMIKTGPVDDSLSVGAVNISLGAQVNIDLNVIDRVIKEFRVRRVGVSDLNEGRKLGWLYFPGKINFKMMIENTGNVDISPSLVKFDIYDTSNRYLLEETVNIRRIKRVQPFSTEEVVAEIPTRLPAGNYMARFSIYNDEDIVHSGEVSLSIKPYGTLQTAGFGFFGLSIPHKISIILPMVSILLLISIIVFIRFNQRRRYSR